MKLRLRLVSKRLGVSALMGARGGYRHLARFQTIKMRKESNYWKFKSKSDQLLKAAQLFPVTRSK